MNSKCGFTGHSPFAACKLVWPTPLALASRELRRDLFLALLSSKRVALLHIYCCTQKSCMRAQNLVDGYAVQV
jgi:hypothetical protein